jgi:epoxyqueuosine reductase QueG
VHAHLSPASLGGIRAEQSAAILFAEIRIVNVDLDALPGSQRCISYLTIENRGAMPLELRERVGELVHGCDICQDVCPWNEKFARELPDGSPFKAREFLAGTNARTLARELLAMSQQEFAGAFKASPMRRAKLRGLKRNASVVLGNVGSVDDVPVLAAALSDEESLVRAHAAWALGRVGSAAAAAFLRAPTARRTRRAPS